MPETRLAIFAKAPVPGYAKTRLIPLLGAEGAARLQERLIERALTVATEAVIGHVTLWCAPDAGHAFFRKAARRFDVELASQASGDLGARMLAAFQAAPGHLVLMGADCPALTPADLRAAATALAQADVVIAPAEDGGYGLIAARQPIPELFGDMPWGTGDVARLTRERARRCDLTLVELPTAWDVDLPEDILRLAETGLVEVEDLLGVQAAEAVSERA
jgi:rSAM/selenodomain-associated transferase 1